METFCKKLNFSIGLVRHHSVHNPHITEKVCLTFVQSKRSNPSQIICIKLSSQLTAIQFSLISVCDRVNYYQVKHLENDRSQKYFYYHILLTLKLRR